MTCDRCNQSPARAVIHGPRPRRLCVRCTRVLGLQIADEVRAGVDFLIDTANSPALDAVMGIVREAVR